MKLYDILVLFGQKILGWFAILTSTIAPMLGVMGIIGGALVYTSDSLGYISAFATKVDELGVALQVSAWPAFLSSANAFVPVEEFLGLLPVYIAFKIAAFIGRFTIRTAASIALRSL